MSCSRFGFLVLLCIAAPIGMAAKSDSRSVGPLLKSSVAHDNFGCVFKGCWFTPSEFESYCGKKAKSGDCLLCF